MYVTYIIKFHLYGFSVVVKLLGCLPSTELHLQCRVFGLVKEFKDKLK